MQIFNENLIIDFADKIKIHPGIIVGRLQQDKYLGYQTNLNNLKVKYKIS